MMVQAVQSLPTNETNRLALLLYNNPSGLRVQTKQTMAASVNSQEYGNQHPEMEHTASNCGCSGPDSSSTQSPEPPPLPSPEPPPLPSPEPPPLPSPEPPPLPETPPPPREDEQQPSPPSQKKKESETALWKAWLAFIGGIAIAIFGIWAWSAGHGEGLKMHPATYVLIGCSVILSYGKRIFKKKRK